MPRGFGVRGLDPAFPFGASSVERRGTAARTSARGHPACDIARSPHASRAESQSGVKPPQSKGSATRAAFSAGLRAPAAFYARLRRRNAATPTHAMPNSAVPGSQDASMRPRAAPLRLDGYDVQSAQRRARLLIGKNHDSTALRTERDIVRMLHPILLAVGGLDQKWQKRHRMRVLANFISHADRMHALVLGVNGCVGLHARTGLRAPAAFYARLRRRNAATPTHAMPNSAVPGSGTGPTVMNVGWSRPVAKVVTVSPSGLISLIWLRARSAT